MKPSSCLCYRHGKMGINTMAQWQATEPYNTLPTLPPEQDIETKAVLKLCIEARAALAELKQAGELIQNQTILINVIPLLEAKDSSEIENIVTTTDKLFQHAQGHDDQADHATKEALRCQTALYKGMQSISKRPLNIRTAIEIRQTIKGVDLDIAYNIQRYDSILTDIFDEHLINELALDNPHVLHKKTGSAPQQKMDDEAFLRF